MNDGYLTFMPRGDGPLVSILLPSRGRPQELAEAVDSCYSLASDKSCLEFVFKLDDDDAPTIARVKHIAKLLPNSKVVISPRGRGYQDMHLWVNDLAHRAMGDWLLVFNDDARLALQNWDQALMNFAVDNPWVGMDQICYLLARSRGRHSVQEFYFLRRNTFNFLGHIAPVCHMDGWVYRLMNFLHCDIDLGFDWINHHSDDMDDATRHEADAARRRDVLNTPKARQGLLYDAFRLCHRLNQLEEEALWRPEPPLVSMNLWRPQGRIDKTANRIILVNEEGKQFHFVYKEDSPVKAPEEWDYPTNGEWHTLSYFDAKLGRSVHG